MSITSIRLISAVAPADVESKDESQLSIIIPSYSSVKPKLPLRWQVVMVGLTCMCTFGHHWSDALTATLKTTIEHELKINNSEFATLISVTNLVWMILSR